MRRLQVLALLSLISLQPILAMGEHNPLLPRPQEVRYGPGRFLLRRTSIYLPAKAPAEDRFSAEQLADCLAQRARTPMRISENSAASGQITLRRTGAADPLPVPGEAPGRESREAYWVTVKPEGVEVRGISSAGLFYGVQTVCQLVEGSAADAALPEVEIRDWPSLVYRGVMMDLSHGALHTERELKRQLDFLARWKINQYYFYSEASIELDGFSLLNPEGRYTKEQVRRIVAYGRERHIDVIPCLELYGHLHDLFRVERYSDLAAVPHGSEFNPLNPDVKALLARWVDQLAEMFPSPYLHMGMDETWELESFAKEKAEGRSPASLYLQHFKSVAEMAKRHGKTVMVWGDIFTKYPEIIPQLPRDAIIVAWDYGPSEDYKSFLAPFAGTRQPVFIATGATNWNQIVPAFQVEFDNVDNFLSTGRPYGVLGMMNTVWNDDAQTLTRMVFPSMAYGAVASWQSAPADRKQFFSDYARATYSAPAAAEAGPGLEKLARADEALRKAVGLETMHRFWDDPLAPSNLKKSIARREDLRQARLFAEDAQEHFARAISAGGDSATLSCFLLGARMIDYLGMKNLYAVEMTEFWRQLGPNPRPHEVGFLLFREINAQNHSRVGDLMDAITELQQPYRAAWLESYTDYRLGTAMGKWDAEFQYWWKLNRRLNRFEDEYREGDPLPPFESFDPER
ncbi:MAG: beta-N-acetylhexosaminidase [Terriglobia bacterium]